MDGLFFSNGTVVLRTLVIGVLAYINLIILLRLSGNRTLSKMNAFDLVVTVALGSTFATILLNRDVSLVQGTAALGLLVAMQYGVTWSSVRLTWVRKLVTGEPVLLLFRGKFLETAMRSARITEDEVRSAVRANGIGSVALVDAVILETDGSFSVVSTEVGSELSALVDVSKPDPN
ncbi:DUF421 domain-containing protein (plasmid) [Pseudomonas iridis]